MAAVTEQVLVYLIRTDDESGPDRAVAALTRKVNATQQRNKDGAGTIEVGQVFRTADVETVLGELCRLQVQLDTERAAHAAEIARLREEADDRVGWALQGEGV